MFRRSLICGCTELCSGIWAIDVTLSFILELRCSKDASKKRNVGLLLVNDALQTELSSKHLLCTNVIFMSGLGHFNVYSSTYPSSIIPILKSSAPIKDDKWLQKSREPLLYQVTAIDWLDTVEKISTIAIVFSGVCTSIWVSQSTVFKCLADGSEFVFIVLRDYMAW